MRHAARPGSWRRCGHCFASRPCLERAARPQGGGGGGMLATGTESLLRQASVCLILVSREVGAEELGRFCARVSALLQAEDWGPDALDALRRLFLIVAATKYSRRLEPTCVALLQTTLCSPRCPERLQLLCAAVLREMAPSDSLSLSCDHAPSSRQLGLVASVLLAQGDPQQVRTVGQCVIKVLESRQPEGPSLTYLLPVVSKVTSLAPDALPEDQGTQQAAGGLAPLRQRPAGGGPRLRGLLLHAQSPAARPCHRGGWDRGHRLLHGAVHGPAFHGGPAAQRAGLLHAAGLAAAGRPCAPGCCGCRRQVGAGGLHRVRTLGRLRRQPPAAARRVAAGEGPGVLPAPPGAERPASPEEGRLGPAEGVPGGGRAGAGRALPAGPLLPVPRPPVCAGPAHPTLRGHGLRPCIAAHRPVLSAPRPMLAFEFVQFCRDHLVLFGSNLDLLRTSFPNLFKFLAWSSPALTSGFVALLPVLVDAGTAVEMLHLLLDLPSLTAALDLQLRASQAASERPLWDVSVRAPGCLEALRDPQAQGLFQHLLRAKASGTVERLTPLHQLLQPLASCARVLQCAQAVPTLLRAFFAAVTQVSLPPRASVPAAEGQLELRGQPQQYAVRAQSAAHSSPQGSRHGGAQRTGASGQAPRLSLPPSSPVGPWPASWHCCSWREVTHFSRLRGMKLTCTGGSLLAAPWGSTPPVPSALVTADPLPSLTPSTHPLALRGLPHRLFPLQRVATSPPLQLLLGRTFQKMPFLKARLVWAYPLASPARGQSPPHQAVVPDRPWGWGLLSGVLSDRVLSSQFPALCKLHPPLVVERAKELLEFVGSLGGPRSTGHMLTSVVWAIGEYLSVSWDRRCSAEQISRFFEALEALLFEVTQSRPSAALPKCPPQVITVLMTTLTKLASRSQDLIPRVSLLLSKMRTLAQSPAVGPVHGEDDLGAVRTRATELLNLLKMPSVAQFVLTPSVEVSQPRYHRDCNTALPLALDMVSRLLEREAGLLPG
ncbi:AP-5 complex subunit zeta-1 isoform X8 [Bos indicus]|uniref:AP-5 complex subunit zeta-1 isoform X8 n=1 Tax=Bos indicus TaxID=9915 RepID=A0ABM4RLF6_BOSIN